MRRRNTLPRPPRLQTIAASLGVPLLAVPLFACSAAGPVPEAKPARPARTVEVVAVTEPPPVVTATASAEPPPPPPPPPPDHIVDVVARDVRGCAIYDNGMLQCWGGFNSHGELGLGHKGQAKTPGWVKGLRGVKKVALARDRTCAVVATGELYCWGINDFAETDARDEIAAPLRVPDLAAVVDVAVSDRHGCAVLAAGTVACWGDNHNGQVGVGKNEVGRKITKPTQVPGVNDVAGIVASGTVTLAWTKGGDLYRWGDASDLKMDYAYPEATKIPVLSGVKRVAMEENQACALLGAGDVRCFSRETFKDFLAGKQHDFGPDLVKLARAFTKRFIPMPKNLVFPDGRGLTGVTDLAVFNHDASAVTEKGEVFSWGSAERGTAGKPERTKGFFPPARIAGVTEAVAITGSYTHRCELEKTGEVRCFGSGSNGQLGSDQPRSSTSAVVVKGLPKIAKIAANDHCTFALGEDHTLWTWGEAWVNACGIDDDQKSALPGPVLVPVDKTVP